jgi:hypothetical protein
MAIATKESKLLVMKSELDLLSGNLETVLATTIAIFEKKAGK